MMPRRTALLAAWALIASQFTRTEAQAAQHGGTTATGQLKWAFDPCTGGTHRISVYLGDPCSGFQEVEFIHDGDRLVITAAEMFAALRGPR